MSRVNPSKKRCGLIKVPQYRTYRSILGGIDKVRAGDTYVSSKDYALGKREVIVDMEAAAYKHNLEMLDALTRACGIKP